MLRCKYTSRAIVVNNTMNTSALPMFAYLTLKKMTVINCVHELMSAAGCCKMWESIILLVCKHMTLW